MDISYLVTLPELAVLAHLCGKTSLPGFPVPGSLGEAEVEAQLVRLQKRGMAVLRVKDVSVDPVAGLLVESLCEPVLLLEHPPSGCLLSVGRRLAVLTRPDARVRGGYVLAPLETAEQGVREWAEQTAQSSWELRITSGGGEPRNASLGLPELRQLLQRDYPFSERRDEP